MRGTTPLRQMTPKDKSARTQRPLTHRPYATSTDSHLLLPYSAPYTTRSVQRRTYGVPPQRTQAGATPCHSRPGDRGSGAN
eukprot:4211193-Pyramimonas_sp.AAC.1